MDAAEDRKAFLELRERIEREDKKLRGLEIGATSISVLAAGMGLAASIYQPLIFAAIIAVAIAAFIFLKKLERDRRLESSHTQLAEVEERMRGRLKGSE